MKSRTLDPIHEFEASSEIRAVYDEIKSAFGIQAVPMMFKYLANHPVFLRYMWDALAESLKDPAFENILIHMQSDILASCGYLLKNHPQSAQTLRILIPDATERLRIADEIQPLFKLQCQLAYFSVGIREAVKGWAIGAKYLSSEEAFHASYSEDQPSSQDIHDLVLHESTSAISIPSDLQNAFMAFLVFLHEEFGAFIHDETYVYARLQAEKALIQKLQLMPHPVGTSYNEVVKLVPDRSDLPHLFYLLSEKFPTVHTVAALMWGTGEEYLKMK